MMGSQLHKGGAGGRGSVLSFRPPSPLSHPTFSRSLARTALSNDDDGMESTGGTVTRVARARNVGRIGINEKVEGVRGRGEGILRPLSCAVGRHFFSFFFFFPCLSVCDCRSRECREGKEEEERQTGRQLSRNSSVVSHHSCL
ncbi:hypothetical protein CTA2_12986 [Colletotrichum tanaceti]|nr:hypothetical protein CTA2_12986 [Colletotrichum tanaceti]